MSIQPIHWSGINCWMSTGRSVHWVGDHCSDIHSYLCPVKVMLLLATRLSTALSNNHCTMEKPTELKLFEYLADLIDWAVFAQYLPGIEGKHIQKIEKEKKGNVDDERRALYKKWLQVYPDASWNDVIEALEKAERKDIVKKVKEKREVTVHQGIKEGTCM